MTPQATFPVNKLLLAVFRVVGTDGQSNPIFKIVGTTFIRQQPADWVQGGWVTALVKPIEVRAGDHLGYFYTSASLPEDQIMIPTIQSESSRAFVYNLDATNINNSKLFALFPLITL